MESVENVFLPKDKWTTAGVYVGNFPFRLKVKADKSVAIRWRCIGVVPGFGRLKNGEGTWIIWNGVYQLLASKDTEVRISRKAEKTDTKVEF